MHIYSARRQPADGAGQTGSQVPSGGGGGGPRRNDKSYQSKSQIVACVDLVLSFLTLFVALFMLIKVVKIGNFPGLPAMYSRPDTVWGTLVVMELISIVLAAMLLKSTSQSSKQQNPKGSACWCNIWLLSCVTWILLYITAIGVVIKLTERERKKELVYLGILILAMIIVLRLGAINIVIFYARELKMYSHQQLHPISA